MTHRERFYKAVTRQRPDRAVFDLCGCPQTLIDYPETREALATVLGIADPAEGPLPKGNLPSVRFSLDDRVLRKLDIDTRLVGDLPLPKTVHNREENGVVYDSYGIGRRVVNGHYEIVHSPLRDCTLDEMMAYPLPSAEDIDPALIRRWAEQARALHERTNYAVIASHPVLGVFEIGCWLFSFDDYLYRMAAEPELVHAFSRRILEYQKRVIELYYGALGRYIDCTTSGDDFGMQTGAFVSVGMFEEMIGPYFRERIAYTRTFTDAFYQHHTCGSVHTLIPSLLDCGVDILNPIQPGTHHMEPERLKRDYGHRLAFWGGIDTQHLLPEGDPETVKAEVKEILAIMGEEGGYILSPAHCIQQDVPAANIAAIYQGAAEYYSE